jgi:hypothetical protein
MCPIQPTGPARTSPVALTRADAPRELVAFVDGLAQDLDLSSPLASARADVKSTAELRAAERLASEGWTELAGLVPAHVCASLVTLVGRIVDAALPAVFVYLHPTVLEVGELVRRRASELLGARYELIEDLWAWKIEPGHEGWPPHRGIDDVLLDRRAPELLNTWVALSDAPVDRACMCFVPLDADASYPSDLGRHDVPAGTARAAPVAAGTALAWNANVLHWGGRCAEDAPAARVSCSFSLARADVGGRLGIGDAWLAPSELGPLDRVDLVASQIATYGEGQPDVLRDVLAWARAACAFRAHASAIRKGR